MVNSDEQLCLKQPCDLCKQEVEVFTLRRFGLRGQIFLCGECYRFENEKQLKLIVVILVILSVAVIGVNLLLLFRGFS